MRPGFLAIAVAATSLVVCTACAERERVGSKDGATVGRVADGDSLVLEGGARVRLLQIDAPELGEGECFGRDALRELERLVGRGNGVVVLEVDPRLDDEDRHRRLLRYVHAAGINVNVELVRRGAATPYFRRGERGLHAVALVDAVEDARDERRGLWGECRVAWDPRRQVETRYR